MDGHQQELRALESEKRKLREELLRREGGQQPTRPLDLRGGNPREHQGGDGLDGAHNGEVLGGPLRGSQVMGAKPEESGERVVSGPSPGLNPVDRGGALGGHRGPCDERGGDPAAAERVPEGSGGQIPSGSGGLEVNGAAGLMTRRPMRPAKGPSRVL